MLHDTNNVDPALTNVISTMYNIMNLQTLQKKGY